MIKVLGSLISIFARSLTLPLPFVILALVHDPACGEIGKDLEVSPFKTSDFRLEKFGEIVGQDVGGHPDGNPIRSLHQKKRDFCRQRHRLEIPPIIGGDFFGDIGIEKGLAGKRRKARFDVAGGSRWISSIDIAEIPLPVEHIALVGQV